MGCGLVADVVYASLVERDDVIYDEAALVGPLEFVVDGFAADVACGFGGSNAEPVSFTLCGVAGLERHELLGVFLESCPYLSESSPGGLADDITHGPSVHRGTVSVVLDWGEVGHDHPRK